MPEEAGRLGLAIIPTATSRNTLLALRGETTDIDFQHKEPKIYGNLFAIALPPSTWDGQRKRGQQGKSSDCGVAHWLATAANNRSRPEGVYSLDLRPRPCASLPANPLLQPRRLEGTPVGPVNLPKGQHGHIGSASMRRVLPRWADMQHASTG
ncbi:hypothetical protein BX600DRAFT_433680 [Xylariales sp. PMI_506]|nr:hypothetical protein BX600DRAFT_433680 [Xylariales sp. PMI_506]